MPLLRHLIGGKLDCFSCAALGGPRHSAWKGVTKLNEHHMFWAWVSMISVGLTDLYIRLVATGAIRTSDCCDDSPNTKLTNTMY